MTLLALAPVLGGAVLLTSTAFRGAEASEGAFRCADATLYFPVSGTVGWKYMDPASTDRDAQGNSTVHTGIDVFADTGPGAPVYAPADGVVSGQPGPASGASLVLPEVTNVLTQEPGLQIYVTHMSHNLVAGQQFEAGEVIGTQEGEHIHFSIGASEGYDDREVDQTQDPSPYFNATLTYDPTTQERESTEHWCIAGAATEPAAAEPAAAEQVATQATQTHIIVSGDTLSAIAETYAVTIDEIVEANGLDDPDALSIGQELTIPGGAAPAPATLTPADSDPPASDPPATGQGSERYLVQTGDTLSAIAERFGVSIEAIVELNGLTDPDVIAAGDDLQIP